MLTKSGAKVLDFGLAKVRAVEAAGGMTQATNTLTEEGVILGTLQYMAPEQLEAKEADARTDIFGFGAVLYEMAAGHKAFEGKSRASLIAAIMTSEPPPISNLQTVTPPALDRVVKKCLAKDPDGRWQSARDLKDELEWIAGGSSQLGLSPATVSRHKNRDRLTWVIAAVAAVAILALGVVYFRQKPVEHAVIRFTVSAPEKTRLEDQFALSPDSHRLALRVTGEGKTSLWVRRLDAIVAQPLAGTEGANHPFWSPDSRFIGFFADEKLKKIDASGGPPVTLCDAKDGYRGTWNRDGVIVFTPVLRGPLYRVSAAGGAAAQITTLDPSRQEEGHRYPQFLPDGRHSLYYAESPTKRENEQIYIDSLDSSLGSKNRKAAREHQLDGGVCTGWGW
jgi:hypothetical protein